jgi:undecaprenyl-phosphate 4-deoxy-4-formamido-L-arabinose transferase
MLVTPPISAPLALSIVIPLYNSSRTIGPLVETLAALRVEGGVELVLVNDGSTDATLAICRKLLSGASIPITLASHSRNFGEHNAVLTGYRLARGLHIVNIDDDGQNPPAEALRLWEYARSKGLDAAYGHFALKEHPLWRNLGSWFANRVTDMALEKPRGFYLSSFRCVTAFVAKEVARHDGPYPYIDGLILQITQNIGSCEVRHDQRRSGRSGYNLRRLVRLWLSTLVNFSVMPLRLATFLGLAMAAAGLIGLIVVFYLRVTNRGPEFGWGSLMGALLLFAGTQLVMLGLIGEYVGRMFLAVNRRPQSVVQELWRSP